MLLFFFHPFNLPSYRTIAATPTETDCSVELQSAEEEAMLSLWPVPAPTTSRSTLPASNVASSSTPTRLPQDDRALTTPSPTRTEAATSIPSPHEARITIRSVVEQSSGVISTILLNPTGAAVAGITTTSLCAVLWWRYFRRIPNAEYVTPALLRYRKVLVGRVVTVGDADGFRFHHTPGLPYLRDWFYPWPPKTTRRRAKDGKSQLVRETISVRIAGVDAPESAHFGKPAQPYSKEAKQFLTSMVQSPSSPDNLTPPKSSFFSRSTNNNHSSTTNAVSSRLVWLYPSHIDQYKRLVATPYVWDAPYIFGKTNVSLAMVKEGLATVYRSAGADYGQATWWAKVWRKSTTGLNALERAETRARRRRIGMWSLGKKFESPEAYKKRVRGEA